MMRRRSSTSSRVQRAAQCGVEPGGLGRRGGIQGQRDQHGALALDQVVAGRLAGRLRVAEDTEQVVAQLERLAERQPDRGELRLSGVIRARQRGADVQRALDGVLRGLVAQYGHRGVDVGLAAGLHRDVEELAGDHLRSAQVEQVHGRADPVPRQPAAAQHLVGPAEQQVAEQDRPGGTVLLGVAAPPVATMLGTERVMRGRTAPPGVGRIHVVVVHEGARVQQLEGGAGADQGRRRRPGQGRRPGDPSSRTRLGTASLRAPTPAPRPSAWRRRRREVRAGRPARRGIPRVPPVLPRGTRGRPNPPCAETTDWTIPGRGRSSSLDFTA